MRIDPPRVATIAPAALLALAALALVACVPSPAGRASPSMGTVPPGSATPTAAPTPPGPTPVPSFVRPTPTPRPTFLAYTVVAGDTLTSIARRFGTTPASIAFWNRTAYPSLDPDSSGYQPDRIRVGWTLSLIPNEEVTEDELFEASPSAPAASASVGAAPTPTTAPSTARPTTPPANRAAVVVRHGARSERMVALTFDMGGRLDPALDIVSWLVANDVPATIFPTGRTATTTDVGLAALEAVADHRDLFDVGNHSWSHPDFRDLDDAAMRDQVERTDRAVVAAVNLSTKPWFRPPYGGIDDQVPAVVGSAGWSHVVLWDIDTIDWRPEADGGPSAADIVAKVVGGAEGGSIVLMHLGGYNTLEALPGIVEGLRARGLRPVTLDEMFGD